MTITARKPVPWYGRSLDFEQLWNDYPPPPDYLDRIHCMSRDALRDVQERRFLQPRAAKRVALLYVEQDPLAQVMVTAQKVRADGTRVTMSLKRKNIRQQLDEFLAQGYDAFATFQGGDKPLEFKELTKST